MVRIRLHGLRVTEEPRGPGPTHSDRVRALWRAHRESRIDDMLALIHPEVHWWPMSRPARSMYEGHAGVRAMLDDAQQANDSYWMELDEVVETAKNVVRARSRVVRPTDQGQVQIHLELVITMRDGLVYKVETTRTDPM